MNCLSFLQRFLFLENCAVKNILKYLQGQLRKLEPFNHMKLMVVGLQVGLFLLNLYLEDYAYVFFEGAQNYLKRLLLYSFFSCGQTSSYFLKLMIYFSHFMVSFLPLSCLFALFQIIIIFHLWAASCIMKLQSNGKMFPTKFSSEDKFSWNTAVLRFP